MSHNHSDHSGHDHIDHDDHGSAFETESQSGLTVMQWKIVSITTIPIIAMLGLLCSIYLSRYKDSLLLVCTTIFAGGILIATGMSHMLFESQEILAGSFGEFPLSYTAFGACFIFLLAIDALAERWSETLVHRDHSHNQEKTEQDVVCAEHEHHEIEKEFGDSHAGNMHTHVHSGHDIANPWAGMFLTLVLSIHSILECLVLGSSTDIEIISSSYTAIAIHKIFEGFALGSGLVASGYWNKGNRRRFYSCAIIFLLLNIIPIGIGMALANTFSENSTAVGVLLALVGGSFFYVGASEFVPAELEKMRVLKLPVLPVILSLVSGYVMMVLVTAFTHPEHDHGDSHEGHNH